MVSINHFIHYVSTNHESNYYFIYHHHEKYYSYIFLFSKVFILLLYFEGKSFNMKFQFLRVTSLIPFQSFCFIKLEDFVLFLQYRSIK
jgi:hypothetical protein